VFFHDNDEEAKMQKLIEKQCPHCKHTWVLRKTNPLRCPNCGRKLTKKGKKHGGGKIAAK
jgi:ssDNA-binding Zn-finger/Zn-ribbon topoisomerase 1